MSIEDYLFLAILLVYLIGFILSYFLHRFYHRKRHSTMGRFAKGTYLVLIALAGVTLGGLIYHTFAKNSIDRTEVIIRMVQMFTANAIFFSMIYFFLYVSNKREFGQEDHDTKAGQTLYGKYLQTIYLSVVTFFTTGLTNLFPLGMASRVFNTLQIIMADVICMFLYSRSKHVFTS